MIKDVKESSSRRSFLVQSSNGSMKMKMEMLVRVSDSHYEKQNADQSPSTFIGNDNE
jgi:hypothetical protein